MSTPDHGFVDKSIREGVYRLTLVRVPSTELGAVTRAVRGAILPGQFRVHLAGDRASRQRSIVSAYARLSVEAIVYVTECPPRQDDQRARDRCLSALLEDLEDRPLALLVFDTRGEQRDRLDRRVLARWPHVRYAHRGSRDEPPPAGSESRRVV